MNRYKLIGIEPISENEIASYTFDGTEIQEKTLNPNEEFIQLTNKIDFKKLNGKSLNYTSQSFYCNDEESEITESHQNNVTEKLKKHISCAIDEITALLDILLISNSKNMPYMQLKKLHKDPPKEALKDAHDENLANYIAGKKMALGAISATILNGAARLSKTLSTNKDPHHQNTFYSDLALLRKEWRIKWFQTHLVGDLGLSSCGSVFPEQSSFQIMEEEDQQSIDDQDRDLDLQSLKIVLMHNQEGEPVMRINVSDSTSNDDNEVKSFIDLPPARDLKYQTERLNRGQNLLFLNEIYSTICWESRLFNCPVLIKENRLYINLRGNESMELDFFILPEKHWFGYDNNTTEEIQSIRKKHEKRLQDKSLSSEALILLMRELMREKHRCNSSAHFSPSNPVAGPVQIPLNKRYHGIQYYRPIDHSNTEQNHLVFLLRPLLDAITFQHARKEILSVIDQISDDIPYGIAVKSHIQGTQSMVNCTVEVVVSSTIYTTLSKHFIVKISVLKAVTKINIVSDYVRHQLVYDAVDVDVLKSFFESQIWNFKFDVLKQLATVKHNWQLVDYRLTNCQNTVLQDINVSIIVLSANGRSLYHIISDHKAAKKYQLSFSYSSITNGELGELKKVNIANLGKRLVKSDLQVIDVLLTAFS